MTHIFCIKHMAIVNAYPNKIPKTTSTYYEGRCGCKFKMDEIRDIKVRRNPYTIKYGELTKQTNPKYEFYSTVWDISNKKHKPK